MVSFGFDGVGGGWSEGWGGQCGLVGGEIDALVVSDLMALTCFSEPPRCHV